MIEQILGPEVAGESIKIKNEIKELVKNFDKNVFDLAESLYKLKKKKLYFPEYMTYKECAQALGVKESMQFYLPKIVEVMEEVGIDRNTYEPLGTSKLRSITSLDPDGVWKNPETGVETPLREFITGMVENGAKMDIDEIKQHVNTLKGLVGERAIENRTYGWTKETVENTIDPATELARRNIGSVARDEDGNAIDASPSRCVETWAIEYLNDRNNQILSEQETKELDNDPMAT